METKICTCCNKEKPLYAYYKVNRRGRHIYEAHCIQCISDQRKMAYDMKKNPSAFIVEKMPIATYSHYLLTLYDNEFNEYVGTISARLHYALKLEMLWLQEFKVDDERLFYEAKLDKMSLDEYYDIHDKYQEPKNILCPNLTISISMSKKQLKEVLHDFLTALYFYHNKC